MTFKYIFSKYYEKFDYLIQYLSSFSVQKIRLTYDLSEWCEGVIRSINVGIDIKKPYPPIKLKLVHRFTK